MGYTLAQKILAIKSGRKKVLPGEIVYVQPDLILLYDWPGFDGLLRDIRIDPDRIALNIDHFYMADTEVSAQVHRNFREAARKYNIKKFYDIGQTGIGFQLMAEKGHIKPGMLVLHLDPHASTFGAFGAYSIGVAGGVSQALLTGEVWLKVPETVKINVTGSFAKGVTSRDLFERLIGDVGPDGALGQVVQYSGPAVSAMSMESRMVLCNSVQYLAAETAIIEPNERTYEYVKARTSETFEALEGDIDAEYAKVLDYDVSKLEPQVVTPPDVYYVKPIKEVAGIDIDQAFIGTCASGRLEDLKLAAQILKGKKVHPRVRFLITPITPQIYQEAAREGLLNIFWEAGAVIGPPTCGPCYGGVGYLLPGEKCITTGTLNIPGRLGSTEAEIYMGNPATVAASAVKGQITDPREFL